MLTIRLVTKHWCWGVCSDQTGENFQGQTTLDDTPIAVDQPRCHRTHDTRLWRLVQHRGGMDGNETGNNLSLVTFYCPFLAWHWYRIGPPAADHFSLCNQTKSAESTRYDADTVKGKCEKLDFWLDFHMGTVNQIYSDKRLKLWHRRQSLLVSQLNGVMCDQSQKKKCAQSTDSDSLGVEFIEQTDEQTNRR